MVLKEGLEPSRYCYHRILSPVRLPFRHFSLIGAPPETRTPDPFIKSEMLYHWASGTIWLGRLDSNQRMPESKSGALPLGYNPIMVDRDGFEPPKPKVSDLQSDAFGHFATCPQLLLYLYIIVLICLGFLLYMAFQFLLFLLHHLSFCLK